MNEELLSMLSYRRPAGSATESKFINRFIRPLRPQVDSYGNRIITVGDNPHIMFSSHTDSVHREPGRQSLVVDDIRKHVWTEDTKSNCLGADCAVGVWLMVNMIRASVPGIYVFHREEEVGGRGSAFIAANPPDWIKDMKTCIAFDRRGNGSIITHQFGARCCSNDFAASLRDLLGMAKLDDGGIFTDSANYVDLIGECTNVSVGYTNEHTKDELLDMRHAEWLLDQLIKADWSKLVFKRQPGEQEPRPPFNFGQGGNTLYQMVQKYPWAAAELLEQCGVTPDDVLAQEYSFGLGYGTA